MTGSGLRRNSPHARVSLAAGPVKDTLEVVGVHQDAVRGDEPGRGVLLHRQGSLGALWPAGGTPDPQALCLWPARPHPPTLCPFLAGFLFLDSLPLPSFFTAPSAADKKRRWCLKPVEAEARGGRNALHVPEPFTLKSLILYPVNFISIKKPQK